MYLNHPSQVALTDARSKAVVPLLLLIHFLSLLPIFVEVLCLNLVLVLLCGDWCPFWFCNCHAEEEITGRFL